MLNLHAVAANVRQIGWHIDIQLHLPRRCIDPHERRHIADKRAHVEPFRVERLPLEQPAHAIDDVASAFVVRADVRKNRADLIEIRRGVLQEQLGRLRVAQDRRERLIDLMCQPRRELAHHRDAPRVRDLLPEQLCLLLSLFARGHVASGATDQDRLARGVELDTALRGNPPGRAIRQHQPVFGLVFASIRTRDRHRVRLPEAFAIIGVQPLQDGVELERL